MLNLGWLLYDLQDYPASEDLFKKAIALRLRHLGPSHRDVAVARVGLVALYITQGKFMAAVPPYLQAMATLRKVEGARGLAESIDLLQRGIIARHLPATARRLMLGLKDDRAVEDCLRRSLALARKALGNHHAYVALVLHELAYTLAQHHKDDEAERYYEDCLRIAQEYGLHHPKATILLANYCVLLRRRGKQGQAEKLLEKALAVRRRHYPPDHPSLADVRVIQAGLLLDDSGQVFRRRQLLREALAGYCRSGATPRQLVFVCVRLLTNDLSARGTYAVAAKLARSANRAKTRGARDKFLDLAMNALRRARQKGFKDATRLQQDKDLAGLRGRKDFQKLVAELKGP
jgi:tetratricopeptide (TPR) repeat protein